MDFHSSPIDLLPSARARKSMQSDKIMYRIQRNIIIFNRILDVYIVSLMNENYKKVRDQNYLVVEIAWT